MALRIPHGVNLSPLEILEFLVTCHTTKKKTKINKKQKSSFERLILPMNFRKTLSVHPLVGQLVSLLFCQSHFYFIYEFYFFTLLLLPNELYYVPRPSACDWGRHAFGLVVI